MLHENPQMLDIDVNHWRNLQELLLQSAKEKRRIIVIHEAGEVLKVVHSQKAKVIGSVDIVNDPHAVAERLYHDNEANVDFVAVFERRAFAEWAGRFQDSWSAEEDLDIFVHRQYALMDEYPAGIVTYPGPARDVLGLQWRVGATYADVRNAVQAFVTPQSTVVLGVFDDDTLWASLVLRFDADRRVDVVTTIDPSRVVLGAGRDGDAKTAVDWVEATYGPCSIALFSKLATARAIVARRDGARELPLHVGSGDVLIERAPAALRAVLGAAVA